MGRYLIKDAKCGLKLLGHAAWRRGTTKGGITVVASVLFEHNGEEKWIHIVEVEGMPNAFITSEDLHDFLILDDYDAEYVRKLENTTGHEIGGISLTAENYYNIYDEIYNGDMSDEDKSFIRFVIAIVRLDWDAGDELKKKAIGHYTDEIDIPKTDKEEDYLEENGDE